MANIELDGANKKIKVDSGDLTLDVPGDIVLDADGGDVVFADGGTNLLKVTNSSSDVVLQPQVDTKDIVFKQYDGTVVATVEDNATFNIPASKLAIGGTAVTSTAAELNILDGVTSTATELNILDGVTSTAAELNIVDGNTSATSTTLADADRVVVNDAGTMKQVAMTDVKTYMGGGLVKLGSSSVGNSTVSTITFDSIFSSTYESYRLIGFVNADTGGAQTNFRLRASSSDVGSSSGYTRIERHTYHDPSDSSSSQQSIHGHNSNEWIIAGGGMRSDSDTAPCWFDLTFFPNTSRQFFNGTASYVKNTNSQVHTGYVGGITQSNLSPDGIRIFPSTGNFKYVDISIFGVTQ